MTKNDQIVFFYKKNDFRACGDFFVCHARIVQKEFFFKKVDQHFINFRALQKAFVWKLVRCWINTHVGFVKRFNTRYWHCVSVVAQGMAHRTMNWQVLKFEALLSARLFPLLLSFIHFHKERVLKQVSWGGASLCNLISWNLKLKHAKLVSSFFFIGTHLFHKICDYNTK